MANTRTLQRSFNGGEVSPEFYGRIDDNKYQSGAAKMRNFIALPHGPAANRPGTKFVAEVKDSTKRTRLIPFTFSTTQTMVIEMGAGYFRFHTQGATVMLSDPSAYKAGATVTITIANPGVVSWNAHGLVNGQRVVLTTTGALPTGLTAGTAYYVINKTDNTFQLAATSGGTAITTSGSQSGTHTANLYYSIGDLVSYSGTNYYRTVAGSGQLPTNTSYWYLQPSTGEYQVPNPYVEEDLFDIHYVQSADVLTLVHPNYAPRELRRYGANNIQLVEINFGAPIAAPTSPTAVAYTPASASVNADTKVDMSYVITALADDNVSESVASSVATCTNNIYVTGAYNTISWTGVSGAVRYYVYKLQGGIYGYIGNTTGTSIVDDNISPDLGKTPPIYNNDFTGPGAYPGAVSYFEQRRCFAGSYSDPQKIWMTKSGTESNMSYSLPVKDDDRIEFKVAAREANTIRHIVPLSQLVLLTSSAEWRVTSVNSDALTPTTIAVRPQSYIGASNVQPLIVNNTMLYPAARGGHMRELAYSWQASGFVTGDLSVRATHLFDEHTISDISFTKSPYPIAWCVRDDGKLLGLTYMPEQQIGAWHQHDTDGYFESVAIVAEGNDDAVYFVVKRNIEGQDVRYVERLNNRHFDALEDAYFVDCGLSYDGSQPGEVTITGGIQWDSSEYLIFNGGNFDANTGSEYVTTNLNNIDINKYNGAVYFFKYQDQIWSFEDYDYNQDGSYTNIFATITRYTSDGYFIDRTPLEFSIVIGSVFGEGQAGSYSVIESATHYWVFGYTFLGGQWVTRSAKVSKTDPTDQTYYNLGLSVTTRPFMAYPSFDGNGVWIYADDFGVNSEFFRYWSFSTCSFTGVQRGVAYSSPYWLARNSAVQVKTGDIVYAKYSEATGYACFIDANNTVVDVTMPDDEYIVSIKYLENDNYVWALTSNYLVKIHIQTKNIISYAVPGINSLDTRFAPVQIGYDPNRNVFFWSSNLDPSDDPPKLIVFDIQTSTVSWSSILPEWYEEGEYFVSTQYTATAIDGIWWFSGYYVNATNTEEGYTNIRVNPTQSTDIGKKVYVTDSNGRKYWMTVTNVISSTVAVVRVEGMLPQGLRAVPSSLWGFGVDQIYGLDHIEGKTVSILADGAVHPQRVVTEGAITLDAPAGKVHVGLPITADLQTLPVTMNIDGFGQGRYKNINKAWIRVYQSSGIFIGPDADSLVEVKQRTTEIYGLAPELKTAEIYVLLNPAWQDSGQVFVRQKDPLPLTVVSLTLQVAVGG